MICKLEINKTPVLPEYLQDINLLLCLPSLGAIFLFQLLMAVHVIVEEHGALLPIMI